MDERRRGLRVFTDHLRDIVAEARADLTIAALERATFDTSRITVNASNWTGP